MRGKGEPVELYSEIVGITPAYAGKRESAKNGSGTQVGSPPPMRGKVLIYDSDKPNVGITPAYAGKSFRTNANCDGFEDHPRLCGEKPVCV